MKLTVLYLSRDKYTVLKSKLRLIDWSQLPTYLTPIYYYNFKAIYNRLDLE